MNIAKMSIMLCGVVALLWAGATADYLTAMEQPERENCIIQLEWSGKPTPEMIEADNLWNTGAYDKAIALITEIENDLGDMQMAISYRTPIQTEQALWATDVLVNSNSVSYRKLELVYAQSGNIFIVAQGDSSTYYRWYVFMSTDGGSNWALTASWNGGTSAIPGLDAAEWTSHVYIGYSTASAANYGRIRRVSETTGAMDTGFGFVDVFNAGAAVNEVNVEPNRETWSELYFSAIDENGTLHYYYTSDPTSWTGIATNINNADRSLDMDYGFMSGGGHYLWISYISTGDSLCALARVSGSWGVHRNIDDCHTSNIFWTGIAHHGDTVMIWFVNPNHVQRYRVTYNDGGSWSYGTPYADSAGSADITGRGGEGWHVCFASWDPSGPEEVYYVTRDYPNSTWSTEIVIGEHDEYINFQMTIDYLGAAGAYGIAYIDDNFNIYFDRADWQPGVAENRSDVSTSHIVTLAPNPSRNQATLSYTIKNSGRVHISLYDATGRLVQNLVDREHAAGNYVYTLNNRTLSAGVYFVKMDTEDGSSSTKMTIVH